MAGVGYAFLRLFVHLLASHLQVNPDLGIVVYSVAVDALAFAVIFGLAAASVLALAAALEAPANLTTATSPDDLLAANRTTVLRLVGPLALLLALVITALGFPVSHAVRTVLGPPFELLWGVEVGLAVGLTGGIGAAVGYIVAFTAWGHWLLFTRLRLPLTGKLPWAVDTFLADAYRRGVLRQSGAVYQFRHVRLQQHLAKAYRTGN